MANAEKDAITHEDDGSEAVFLLLAMCIIKLAVVAMAVLSTNQRWVGFDQLCWHNFRIIGANFSMISTEHNSGIIGSDSDI